MSHNSSNYQTSSGSQHGTYQMGNYQTGHEGQSHNNSQYVSHCES